MGLDLISEEVKKAGDLLCNEIVWNETPQGYMYWHKVKVHLEQMGGEEFDANHIGYSDWSVCDEIAHYIRVGFTWKATNQGWDYWNDVYNNIFALSKLNNHIITAEEAYDRAMGVI